MKNPGDALHNCLESLVDLGDEACSFVRLAGCVIDNPAEQPKQQHEDLRILYGSIEWRTQWFVGQIVELEKLSLQSESDIPVERLARLWLDWLTITDAFPTLDSPQLRYMGPLQVLTALLDSSGEADAHVKELAHLLPMIKAVRTLCARRSLQDRTEDILNTVPSSPELEALLKEMSRKSDAKTSHEAVVAIDRLTALRDGLALSGKMPGSDQPGAGPHFA